MGLEVEESLINFKFFECDDGFEEVDFGYGISIELC